MKYTKLLLGTALTVTALWVIIGEQMTGASANAVINAPVVTLRAPVAGNLNLSDHQIGARVSSGEFLATMDDPLVDRVRLNDLLMQLRTEEASATRLGTELLSAQSLQVALRDRSEDYRVSRREELLLRLEHAERRLNYLEAQPAGRITAGVALPSAQENFLTLDTARERVRVLQLAVAAVEENVFIGDSFNDAPIADQRLHEIQQDIARIGAAKAEAEARISALSERIDKERLRVNNSASIEMRAPVEGIYWEILQADGVNVQRGDPILRLVDCSSSMVTLSVTERIFNRLTVGQPAKFRVSGTSELYEGTVSRLAGSGAETIYRNLAVAPSQKHLERYDVSLIIPSLQAAGAENCQIGRTGRVFFDTRPLDWLRSLRS